MSIFTIDQDKCQKDGICAAVCPVGIIAFTDEDTFPRPSENSEELCISCGHCSAVCPHGALHLSAIDPGSLAPVRGNLIPSEEQLTQLICSRRSTRAYKDRPVDRETIKKVIDLAAYAPSARNSQLLQWMVIDSREEIKRLQGHTLTWMKDLVARKDATAMAYGFEEIVNNYDESQDIILRNAPGLVIIYAPAIYPYALVDSTIGMTTFELAASAFNVGTCWAGFFMRAAGEWKPLQQALNLPKGHSLTSAMIFGHPKYSYSRFPKRKEKSITWR